MPTRSSGGPVAQRRALDAGDVSAAELLQLTLDRIRAAEFLALAGRIEAAQPVDDATPDVSRHQ